MFQLLKSIYKERFLSNAVVSHLGDIYGCSSFIDYIAYDALDYNMIFAFGCIKYLFTSILYEIARHGTINDIITYTYFVPNIANCNMQSSNFYHLQAFLPSHFQHLHVPRYIPLNHYVHSSLKHSQNSLNITSYLINFLHHTHIFTLVT